MLFIWNLLRLVLLLQDPAHAAVYAQVVTIIRVPVSERLSQRCEVSTQLVVVMEMGCRAGRAVSVCVSTRDRATIT